jgi:hypothetical protein
VSCPRQNGHRGPDSRDSVERIAIAGQIQWDNQLDAVSANLVRRRSATCCRAIFGETGQI